MDSPGRPRYSYGKKEPAPRIGDRDHGRGHCRVCGCPRLRRELRLDVKDPRGRPGRRFHYGAVMNARGTFGGSQHRAATWRSAALFSALLLLATVPAVTRSGLAATIALASKPLTIYRTCILTANPTTSTAATD